MRPSMLFRSVADPLVRCARGGAFVASLVASASCGSSPPAPSALGYQLRTEAVSYAENILGTIAAPAALPARSDGFVVNEQLTPDAVYLPSACTGSTTFSSSRESVTLDWHCTASPGTPARVSATLDYKSDGEYAGFGFINATVDSDDALFGSYFTLVPIDAPCVNGDCVSNVPFGDSSQLPKALYTLATNDPAIARTSMIALRYEDQWAPRSCDAQTTYHPHLAGGPGVRIDWHCVYSIGTAGQTVGTTAQPAYWNGLLQDRDGDGTYEGLLSVDPLSSTDTVAPTVVAAFTLTPQ